MDMAANVLYARKMRARAADWATQETTLPGMCYVDEDFYQFELDAVYHSGWFCVGRADQVPSVGDHFTLTLGDEPLLVVRDQTASVAVLSPVCGHCGAVLAQDDDDTDRILRCPHDNWRYDLQGNLVAPAKLTSAADGETSLSMLRTELWNGFVFASFNSDVKALSEHLAEVTPLVKNYGIGSLRSLEPVLWDFDTNWKIILENSMECYHCSHLHLGYHDCAPGRNTEPSPLPESDCAVVMRIRLTIPDAAFVPGYKALFPPLPGLTDEQREHMMWVAVLPNLVLSCGTDNVHYLQWTPRAPGKIDLTTGWMYPPEVIDRPDFAALYAAQMAAHKVLLEQDEYACRQLQRGLQSSFAAQSPLSWQEETIIHFKRWLISRYTRASLAGSD